MTAMLLADVLANYSDGDEHGWAMEFGLLRVKSDDRLVILTADIQRRGILEPILLGDDGRVWDGHHRLCVAHMLGLTEVPVMHAADLRETA